MNIYALLWIFIVWHYALRCGYISDDHAVLAKRKDIIPDTEKHPRIEEYWIKIFNDGIILHFWDKFMHKIGMRKIPFAWHLIMLFLHLINTVILYKIIFQMNPDIAAIACFLWAINPMLNQNVAWISGRPYVIGAMLIFISILNWRQPLVVLPCYALSVITNISGAFLPVILILMHGWRWQNILYISVMVFAGAPFILWKFHQRFSQGLVLDRENFRWGRRKLNALVRVYAYYVWTILCPVRMGWYHQAGFRFNEKWLKFNIYTLMGYALVIILIKQGFWGWWFMLFLIPNMNIFATNSFLQDRYLYMASIGLWIILSPIFFYNPVLFYMAATFYGVRSYMHSRHLINDEEMYRENWRLHPNSDYAINNLSFFMIQQKKYDEARVVIMQGLSIQPLNKMLWYNLGVTWAAQGHFSTDEGKFRFLRAVDCWKKALEIEPRWRRPAEDLKKLIKLLIEKKVLTVDKQESTDGKTMIDIPFMGDINATE